MRDLKALYVVAAFICVGFTPLLQAATGSEASLNKIPHPQNVKPYQFWEDNDSVHDLKLQGTMDEIEVVARPLPKRPDPEAEYEEKVASPDSLSWDPVRYMMVPFQIRTKHGMEWGPADIDTRDLHFDELMDVTDELPANIFNNVNNLLVAGDLAAAKEILQAHYGQEVEIIQA